MAGSSHHVPSLPLVNSIDASLDSVGYPFSGGEDGEWDVERLSKLTHNNRVAERVWNVFLCAWNAWARFALVAAARRDAEIEVRFYVNRYVDQWLTKEDNNALYKLVKAVLHAWFDVHAWSTKMRKLSFTSGRLLERCQYYEVATAKQLMFALWLSRLQTYSPEASPKKQSSIDWARGAKTPDLSASRASSMTLEPTPTRQSSSEDMSLLGLCNALESLVSVRTRRWRLICDIRGLADESLYQGLELHGAMEALLSQAPRALVYASEENDHLAAQRLANVLHLSSVAEKCEQQLQKRLGERQFLLDDFLKCIASAIGLAIECQKTGARDVDKLRAVDLFAADLSKLMVDEKEFLRACVEVLDRTERANFDIGPLGDTSQEVFGVAGSMTRGNLEQNRALDGAGKVLRKLLQRIATGMGAMRDDARRVLSYANDSDLTKKFHEVVAALPPLPSLIESGVARHISEDFHIGMPANFLQEAVTLGVLPVGKGMKVDEFLRECRLKRIQPVWQSWVLCVQSARKFRSVGTAHQKVLRCNSYIRQSPHIAAYETDLFGGPAGPASRATVQSVERLLCGM